MTTYSFVAAGVLMLGCCPNATAQTLPYDHLGLLVSDASSASEWYVKHLGGKRDTGNRIMYGATVFSFQNTAVPKGTAGSVVDHVGFSFPDVDVKMKELEAAGAKVLNPVRDVPGLFKLGFVEDPWGVKIELVEDHEALGFHHIHLSVADPEAGATGSGSKVALTP